MIQVQTGKVTALVACTGQKCDLYDPIGLMVEEVDAAGQLPARTTPERLTDVEG
ncbi:MULTISPECIES: hypothetical protein [unclassified Brenneria]|uniref:hypothetical protein n=1 Tax=unclassified Brenneria TaxID=2634434 RepID=UPI0029C11BCF|nr:MULTISPECIES: hypothetical protein [unclassified Brenneria]MDX5629985.1 hypothetical protein [Brenneria sp. L3-3Z]MDX5697131.1 hypothetical protein [Brenneria sp. L4-2C]